MYWSLLFITHWENKCCPTAFHGTVTKLFQHGFPKYPVWKNPLDKQSDLLVMSNMGSLPKTLLRMGYRVGLHFHWISSVRNFLNKLWWEMTLFEFRSLKDIFQNTVQNNGSLVVEVWKHEKHGLDLRAGGHTKFYMRWETPLSTHTLCRCLISLSLYSLQNLREAQKRSLSQGIWGQLQGQRSFLKQDISTGIFSRAQNECLHFHH